MGPTPRMLCTKAPCQWHTCSGEGDFKRGFLPYIGVAAILVICLCQSKLKCQLGRAHSPTVYVKVIVILLVVGKILKGFTISVHLGHVTGTILKSLRRCIYHANKCSTIVDIFTFMSRIKFVLSWVEHEKSCLTSGSGRKFSRDVSHMTSKFL